MMRIMNDRTPEELRYKVRRRSGFGDEQRWEILGPRGWTVEGEASDGASGSFRLAARQLVELFRKERKRPPAARY
jgi:hypothetical protein